MLVSVVIVNWNAREHLLRCLASLEQHPPPGDWEAVVVDNGSTDGSLEAVRAKAPWASVISNPANLGLAAANNQGIAATSGAYILLSNADVVYQRGAIAALCEALDRHRQAAIAMPQLVQTTGERQICVGSLPTLRETLLGALDGRRRTMTEGHWWRRWPHDEERTIGHGDQAAYLVRRAAVDEVGPQDERFILDWEGLDWSARMGQAGWEIWFVPQAAVTHVGGVSLTQVPVRWIISSHRGMYMYFADRRAPWQRPILAALFAARALVKMAVVKVRVPVYELAQRRARLASPGIGAE